MHYEHYEAQPNFEYKLTSEHVAGLYARCLYFLKLPGYIVNTRIYTGNMSQTKQPVNIQQNP